jgi:hypothetical protein
MSTQAECVERRSERRLILEGKLPASWVTELTPACEKARGYLQDRELVIDVKNLTAISQESEDVLLELMSEPRNRKEAEIEPTRSSLRASTLTGNYPQKVFTEFWPF